MKKAAKTKENSGQETNLVRRVTMKKKSAAIQSFSPGDTVSVHVKVKEGEKERIQIYKGVVIKIQGSGVGRSFTVRKISAGVGVERTFPFTSPIVEKVDLIATGKVRRAKLYYLRELAGKASKIESELAISKETAAPAAAAE